MLERTLSYLPATLRYAWWKPSASDRKFRDSRRATKKGTNQMKKFRLTLVLCTALLPQALPLAAGSVVTDWNTIASTTIVKNGGKPPSSSPIWFAYASLAVYDAVNAITGQYRPFYYHGAAPQSASVEAAAVAAAHRVLASYFPDQQNDLDARFTASLSAIGADPAARDAGVAAGEAAAASLIAARTGDGLEANVPYTPC